MKSSPEKGNPMLGKANNKELPTATSNPVKCGQAVEKKSKCILGRTGSTTAAVSTREIWNDSSTRRSSSTRRTSITFARVNVEFQYNMDARPHDLETCAGSRFLSDQMCLISQFTSEANHALGSQREHLINEASLELSRRREQAQHLQAELQLKAASHVSESSAGLCYVTTKLGYDKARKRAIQMSLRKTSRCSHFSCSECFASFREPSSVKNKVAHNTAE